MAYSELPKLKKNSVSTTIAAPGINDTDTTIPVTELSVFYDADNNLITKGIVIGYDNATEAYAEEITITGASGTSGGGNLTGATRGVNADGTIGAAKSHIATTNIAVMFSTGIYENIRDNQIAIEANTRQILTANTTYYVATTGSDVTGDGTSGNPWATIQHAYNYIVENLDTAGYTTTIQLADGTYTTGIEISKAWSGGGNIVIQGNVANMDNVFLNTSYFCVFNNGTNLPAKIKIDYVKFSTTGGDCVRNSGIGVIELDHFNMGASALYHISAIGPGAYILLGSMGNGAVYTISGSNAISHLNASDGGYIIYTNGVVTLSGTITSPTFYSSDRTGVLFGGGTTFTGTYTITGVQYSAASNSVIHGGFTFPIGLTAGTTSTGGQYI